MSGELDPAGFADFLAGRVRWIALAVFAAAIAAGAIVPGHDQPSPLVTAAGAVVAVGAATLLVFRLRPRLLYAAAATAGIAILSNGQSSNIGWFGVCLLAGACVLTGHRREGLAYWAGAMILFAAEWLSGHPDPGWGAWLAGVTLTAAFSLLVRHDRELLARLRQAQAGLAQQARTQERNRIARELHDVIGHTLTVSLLHVQSARLAVEHDPSDAARALAEAERLGRECLDEVRMTVGMLRQDGRGQDGRGQDGRGQDGRGQDGRGQDGRGRDETGQDGGTAPLPGVDGLPSLIERFRSAGADVTFTVDGDTGGWPALTGLAVYRILQEALTNAVKHAPGSPAEVRLAVGGGQVTLTVDSRAEPGTGTGLGVVSMRERAESLGGRCEAGPGGGGWLVRATLPLDARPRPVS